MLATLAGEWSRGLDLFAGSGALGIEALSRGADWIDFVDQEPRCCAIIKQNLAKVGLAQKAHVYCCGVSKAISFLDNEYDVIFMDPPYSDKSIENLVAELDNSKLISDKSFVVITHSSRFPLENRYGRLRSAKQRRHGDTCISIFYMEAHN